MAEITPDHKNIVVLGLTQNGKSSFVNSILRYAQLENTEAPIIGNGSTSQTKDIRKYSTKINIRRYSVRRNGQRTDLTHNSEGSRVVITYDNEGRVASQKYEPLTFKESFGPETGERLLITQEFQQNIRRLQAGLVPDIPEPSGCFVKLNMYDTPGLSDSGGIKDLERDFMKQGYTEIEAKEAATKCTRNLIDEKNKLSIINTVNKMQVLHGVCIVVRDGKNFGQELKELKSLVEPFRSISSNLNFYIIHTRVTNITMFQAKTLNRIRMAEEFFKLRATHFFVNNEPDLGDDEHEGDPLSQHFANRVLSDFLFELAEAPGVKVGTLQYQKADRILEEVVASSLRIYSSYLESTNRSLREKIQELQIKQRPCIQKSELYDKELEELRLKRSSIDTRERVLVGEDGYDISVGFFRSAHTVTFSILTDTPIRHVEYNPTNHQDIRWDTESEGIGGFKSSPKLTVYNGEFKARVTAFSYRSDLEEDKIASIVSQMNSISELRDRQSKEIERFQHQVDRAKSKIGENVLRLHDAETLKTRVLSHQLSEEEISDLSSIRIQLRHTNSLYCVAKSYRFDHLIPKKLIPNIVNHDSHSPRNLHQHAEFHYQMRKIVVRSLKLIKHQAVTYQTIEAQLQTVCGILEKRLNDDSLEEGMMSSLNRIMKSLQRGVVSNTTTGKEAEFLSNYKSRIHELLQAVEARLEHWTEETSGALIEVFEGVCNLKEHIEETIKDLGLFREDWNIKLRFHEESFDAAHQTIGLLEKEYYSLENFTILRLAFEDTHRNPEAIDPFIKLAQSIAYANQISKADYL
ncbi:hypothetical protein TWF225_008785 [Orbilia oligospora]|nr:hypothetical protein TWF225_008785 [Orbilia oligospora]KAF3254582.1 hypothetical protein TWF217_006803 [Orbilia oligospora]